LEEGVNELKFGNTVKINEKRSVSATVTFVGLLNSLSLGPFICLGIMAENSQCSNKVLLFDFFSTTRYEIDTKKIRPLGGLLTKTSFF
jgi:hypothetical protein